MIKATKVPQLHQGIDNFKVRWWKCFTFTNYEIWSSEFRIIIVSLYQKTKLYSTDLVISLDNVMYMYQCTSTTRSTLKHFLVSTGIKLIKTNENNALLMVQFLCHFRHGMSMVYSYRSARLNFHKERYMG